jgi:hypothetical protein
VVATIGIHGMLLSSIGLALAVWIQRQSRAIGLSVILAVLIGAGWPIFAGISRMGPPGEGLLCLSPFVASVVSMEHLSRRDYSIRSLLWWIPFWDLECLVMSVGLLWMTVRTFNGCFGRIPERPRRISVLSDVLVLLAALLGTGGLFGAIAIWAQRFAGVQRGLDLGILAVALLIAVGLLLLSVKAPMSISRVGMRREPAPEAVPRIPDGRWFAGRWWESFRLVLLLAIGPALLGLAVATVHRPVMVIPKVTKLPDGSQEQIYSDDSGTTYVMTTAARGGGNTVRLATEEEIAGLPVRLEQSHISLLIAASLAVLTILAHGAWIVSLGLALGIGIRRRSGAIAASVGLFLLVTVAWPIVYGLYVSVPNYPLAPRHYPQGLVLASPVPALFVLLHGRYPEDMVWWAASWAVGFLLLAVIVAATTIWILDRKSRACPSSRGDAEEEGPVIETALAGD